MNLWKKCSSCKADMILGQKYFVCSVSTCSGRATNYAFCSINCWDSHLPIAKHRADGAGALERKAPLSLEAVVTESKQESSLKEDEVLVVVSKVKKYIVDKSGMNTSAGVYQILTDKIKKLCDLAIQEARNQGRKTVMDRDFS